MIDSYADRIRRTLAECGKGRISKKDAIDFLKASVLSDEIRLEESAYVAAFEALREMPLGAGDYSFFENLAVSDADDRIRILAMSVLSEHFPRTARVPISYVFERDSAFVGELPNWLLRPEYRRLVDGILAFADAPHLHLYASDLYFYSGYALRPRYMSLKKVARYSHLERERLRDAVNYDSVVVARKTNLRKGVRTKLIRSYPIDELLGLETIVPGDRYIDDTRALVLKSYTVGQRAFFLCVNLDLLAGNLKRISARFGSEAQAAEAGLYRGNKFKTLLVVFSDLDLMLLINTFKHAEVRDAAD